MVKAVQLVIYVAVVGFALASWSVAAAFVAFIVAFAAINLVGLFMLSPILLAVNDRRAKKH